MNRHKLIILVGMSPAVITETVYALWINKDVPDEVIAVTTEAGKKEIQSQLIDSGVWTQMLNDLNLNGKIKFGLNSQNVRIIPDASREKDSCDIATTDDNNEMADFLLTELRKYTENPEVEKISFSIAGGRKSMSAVGALVMTLLGRRNDRLYHVLVQQPYDNPHLEPKFYYPQKGKIHQCGDEKFASTDAVLQLGEIPFVRCRYWFEEKTEKIMNYSTLVSSINQNRVKIRIDSAKQELYINDQFIKLSFFEFVLYWMFAERCKHDQKELLAFANDDDVRRGKLSVAEGLTKFITDKKINKKPGKPGRGHVIENCIFEGQITDDLAKKISAVGLKIVNQIAISLPTDVADKIRLTRSYGHYAIGLNKDDIEIL